MTHAIIIITNVDSDVLDAIVNNLDKVKGKDSMYTIMIGETLQR